MEEELQDDHWSQAKNTFKEQCNSSNNNNNNNISHKPQIHNINYIKNRTPPLLHMLYIYATILIIAQNIPHHLAMAHRSTLQELNGYSYGIEMRKRDEPPQLNISHVEMSAAIQQPQIEEFAPKFRNPQRLISTYAKPTGSFIRLSCPAIGNPQPNITWTLNNTEIVRRMGKVRQTKWAINMEDLVPADSGSYMCQVCNLLGCIEHVKELLIVERLIQKPIVLQAPANLTLPINGSGQMKCEYLSDLYQSMAWTFMACNTGAECSTNRTIIKQDVGVLEFENVTIKDQGWYSCIAANSFGRSMSSAFLRIVSNILHESDESTVTKSPEYSTSIIVDKF